MISPDCNISVFIESIKSRDPYTAIHLADKEATKAERNALRSNSSKHEDQPCGQDYSEQLKSLIRYIRYSTKPKLPEGHDFLKIKTLHDACKS